MGEGLMKQPVSIKPIKSSQNCRKFSECPKVPALAASAAVPTGWSP